ncbi:MAG: flagellar hook-associated protein FlgK [Lachnospiraceae bacterium]|nr:flagellar hook-associated protein FlgK [Lachnospiraceae bacterium]
MSLFSSLYTGQSGIQTSQNALNTTAHNLSNIETQGYVRQQVLQDDRVYNPLMGQAAVAKMQSGIGVEYAKVRQVRDDFLDTSYRKEIGRASFYDTYYEATNEIDTFLGELTGSSFKSSLSKLWTSVEELKKDPASAVTEGQFVSCAAEFLERAQAVYDGLKDYQDNLNAQVKDIVDTINELGQQVCKYNDMITRVEVGSEEANDIRDARNLILDELGKYGNITYEEDPTGSVDVQFEGVTFVTRGRQRPFEMGVETDDATGFHTPVWLSYNGMEVFNCNQEISSKNNTNIGQLKSLVLARGDRRANYTDLAKGYPQPGDDIYNYGTDHLNPDGTHDKRMATANSILLNTMAEFDSLVHGVVTQVNNILAGEDTVYSGQGGADVHNAAYAAGTELPKELFVRLGSERYEKQTDGSYKYIQEDTSSSPADTNTMYTVANLKINPELLKEPTLLGYPDANFTKPDQSVDQTKADKLAEAFSTQGYYLNPNVTKKSNFVDLYSDMVASVATAGYIYKSISESQNATAREIDNSRQQIMGVSSNEELQNMIKFQNAFNAASRYINAVNDMIDNIINRLGG